MAAVAVLVRQVATQQTTLAAMVEMELQRQSVVHQSHTAAVAAAVDITVQVIPLERVVQAAVEIQI
jgi:hypothetical protein